MSDPSSQPTQPLTEPTTVESAAADALAAQIHRVTGLRVDAAGCADMARTAIAAVRPLIEAPYAQAALKIAIALDTLGGRIYRDIHPEAADIAEDPEVDKVQTAAVAVAWIEALDRRALGLDQDGRQANG